MKKQGYAEIESTIFLIKTNKQIAMLLKANNGDFELLYSLYLLRNISYYLLKYMRQNPLHQQAYWLLAAWEQALKKAVKIQPRAIKRIPV